MGQKRRSQGDKSKQIETLKASVSFDLPAGQDGKRAAPTEFRVFPAGTFDTVKGKFTFSPKSATSVMEHYQRRQNPLMGDYEHQTDAPALGFPPMIAPASITEMTPEVRFNAQGEPELWVTGVKWTDRARAFLEAGEYRMISPTFLHDKETGEVLALLRIALTNDPAMNDLEPLVAATSAGDGADETTEAEGEDPMADQACTSCASTKAHLENLNKDHQALLSAHQELMTKHEGLIAKLKSFDDWAAEEKKEHEQLKAITGKDNKAEQLGVLTAFADKAKKFDELSAKVESEKIATLAAKYESEAKAAVESGKLPPAVKTNIDNIVKTDGIEKAFSFLTAFVGEAKPVVKTQETHQVEPSKTTLTASDLDTAKKLGLTAEQMVASKESHAAYLAGARK